MNSKGKFIVIESNDDAMKNNAMEELNRRLADCKIYYAKSSDIKNTLDGMKDIAKRLIGDNLSWKTEFLLAESVLLEVVGDDNHGLKSLINKGENVVLDYYDTSICVNFVPNRVEANATYIIINKQAIKGIKPDIRILLATSKSNLSKENCNKYIDKLVRFKEIYFKNETESNCQIVHFSEESFNASSDRLEEIIRKVLF